MQIPFRIRQRNDCAALVHAQYPYGIAKDQVFWYFVVGGRLFLLFRNAGFCFVHFPAQCRAFFL